MVSLQTLLPPALSSSFLRHHHCPLILHLRPPGRRHSALNCFPTIALHLHSHHQIPNHRSLRYLILLLLPLRRLFRPNPVHPTHTLLTPGAFPSSTSLVLMVTILVCGIPVLRSTSPCTQCPNPCRFLWLKCISMILLPFGYNPLSRRFQTVPGWTFVV